MANYADGRLPTKTRCHPVTSAVNKQLSAPKIVLPASDLTAPECSPTHSVQPFMWLSAVRLRSTMLRRDVGNSIAAESSKDVSVRETVSIVKPR
jgi:hypothetical protein